MRWIRNCIAAEAVSFSIAGACAPQGAGQENVPGISLRIDRSFAAARDKVFGLWTDSQVVAKWFLRPENAHRTEPPTFAAHPGGGPQLAAADMDVNGFRTVRADAAEGDGI